MVVVFLAATINAQNDEWRQRIERAKEAVADGRYDEAATSAAEAMNLVDRASTKDARLPITINLLAVAKHLQGRFFRGGGAVSGCDRSLENPVRPFSSGCHGQLTV